MRVTLTVTEGPHAGQSFTFAHHDNFLVGRSKRAHFRLQPAADKDRYVSRLHFMVEVNPPLCRAHDMRSRNGTLVNGRRVTSADLKHGDEIAAGDTKIRVEVHEAVTAEWEGVFDLSTLPPAGPPAAPAPRARAALTVCPACREAPPAGGDLLCRACREDAHRLPQQVPGYRLVRELGRGAMGVVHLAVREADGDVAAVKTVVPAGARPGAVERFLREANILRSLDHPHIVAFREMGEAEGRLFFAMEYVPGTDAARLLRGRGRLPVRTAVRLVDQLLLALEYAHAKKFVHRDVKPANLLVAVAGARRAVKVADFGLARVYQASQLSGLTLQNDLGGTVGFMAPEQITNFRDAQPAADQYSAAATLYNLLTGRFVYDLPETVAAQLAMILRDDPVPITRRRAGLPPRLAAAVHRALSRDPARRFADVREFRRALLPYAR